MTAHHILNLKFAPCAGGDEPVTANPTAWAWNAATRPLPQSVGTFLLTKWLTVQGRVGTGSRLVDAKACWRATHANMCGQAANFRDKGRRRKLLS